MSEGSRLKLAVVTPIPTPYRDGFWNVLASRDDVDLAVYYCAAGKGDRPWTGDWPRDYHYEVLPGRNLLNWKGADASAWDNPAIIARLMAMEPDAVLIGGYNHPTMLRALRYCIAHDIPYFLMCESHLESQRSLMRRLLKERLVRWAVANMAGGLPTGTLASDYLGHYGARPETLACLPNVPDVGRIAAEAEVLRNDRAALRRELGLPSGPVLLFAGRLIPKKGAARLISAMEQLPENVSLVIVGDGPERETLVQQAQDGGLDGRVHFVGFVEPDEIVHWYAAADLFVLPSQETWGVVVLEALAAGVPVILSAGVGCHSDVVDDPALGEVVRGADIGDWAAAIGRCLANDRGAEFEQARRALIARFGYTTQANSLVIHLHHWAGEGASNATVIAQ